MEVSIVSLEKGMAKLRVTVPGAELSAMLDKTYEVYVKNHDNVEIVRENITRIPGGETIVRQAVEDIFADCYTDAVKGSGLAVASEPQVSVLEVSEEDGVVYQITFAVRPEVKLGRYKGIHVKMPDFMLTEEEFAQVLRQAEAGNARAKTVDRPAALGDTTIIDFTGYLDGVAFEGGAGSDYPLVLGSGSFIPGFEEQLVGAAAGEDVTVNVTFPEQYPAENLAGKATVFQVKVKSVQIMEAVPLTEQEREQLRMRAQQEKKNYADQMIEDEVLSRILAEAEMEIPEAMLKSEVNICMNQFVSEISSKGMDIDSYCQRIGKTQQQMAVEMEPLATRRIQLRLVLSAIAEAEAIDASEEEVEARWDEMAAGYGVDKATLKAYVGEGADAQVRAEVINAKAYALLRESTILDQE